jgi:hypothetical protein
MALRCAWVILNCEYSTIVVLGHVWENLGKQLAVVQVLLEERDVLGTPERVRGGTLDRRSEYLPHPSARTTDLALAGPQSLAALSGALALAYHTGRGCFRQPTASLVHAVRVPIAEGDHVAPEQGRPLSAHRCCPSP